MLNRQEFMDTPNIGMKLIIFPGYTVMALRRQKNAWKNVILFSKNKVKYFSNIIKWNRFSKNQL